MQADRVIAKVAINDAVARHAEPAKITKANNKIVEGNGDVGRGRQAEAIADYGNAWSQLVK